MIHTITVLVEDRPGMLNRIVSLWRQRMYNIESLSVGHSEKPGISRMTFTVDGARTDVEQAIKQMRSKVIGLFAVVDLTNHNAVHREIALVKVAASGEVRSRVIEIAKIFRANIIDISPRSIILEITGSEEKVDAFLSNLDPFGVIEVARTGRVSMTRGPEAPLHKAVGTRTPLRR